MLCMYRLVDTMALRLVARPDHTHLCWLFGPSSHWDLLQRESVVSRERRSQTMAMVEVTGPL